MNTKKLLALLLCVLMVTSVTMTACTGNDDPTTSGKPSATTQPSVPTTAGPADVIVEMNLINQYGKALEGKLNFTEKKTQEKTSVTFDANGKGSAILSEGEYSVEYEELPIYCQGVDYSVTITKTSTSITLNVSDNTPNGSEERPFPLLDENATFHFTANATYWFSIRAGEGRNISIENPNVEVSCPNEAGEQIIYKPDENGVVKFHITAENPITVYYFTVSYKSDVEADIELLLQGDPGTFADPYKLESKDLGTPVTIMVAPNGTLYYKWTADRAGTLTLSVADAQMDIVGMTKTSEGGGTVDSGVTGKGEDGTLRDSVTLTVEKGDSIVVRVSHDSEDVNGKEVTFTLSIA